MSHMFRARTQKRIEKVNTEALKIREKGITAIREAIENGCKVGEREETRELIAAMNYSVSQVQRELRDRRKKK